jgi:hypothetical protein
MALTFHRHHRTDVELDLTTPLAVPLGLDGELWSIAPALAFTSDGRYAAVDADDPTAAVRIVPLRSPDELAAMTAASPVPVIVFERRGAADGRAVADTFSAGVAAIVDGPSVKVLVAHIDAVLRRLSTFSH